MSGDDLLVIPDFGTDVEVSAILAAHNAAVAGSAAGAFADVRTRHPLLRTEVLCRNIARICQPFDFEQINAVRDRMTATMREFFDVPVECPEFTLLTEMRVGDSHVLHADSERQTPTGAWEPNHTPFRTRVGLLYLNTNGVDYQGGVLHLPGLARAISPTRGMFVAFPSGRRHVHEVARVDAGKRLTLTVWLTADPSRVEPWAT